MAGKGPDDSQFKTAVQEQPAISPEHSEKNPEALTDVQQTVEETFSNAEHAKNDLEAAFTFYDKFHNDPHFMDATFIQGAEYAKAHAEEEVQKEWIGLQNAVNDVVTEKNTANDTFPAHDQPQIVETPKAFVDKYPTTADEAIDRIKDKEEEQPAPEPVAQAKIDEAVARDLGAEERKEMPFSTTPIVEEKEETQTVEDHREELEDISNRKFVESKTLTQEEVDARAAKELYAKRMAQELENVVDDTEKPEEADSIVDEKLTAAVHTNTPEAVEPLPKGTAEVANTPETLQDRSKKIFGQEFKGFAAEEEAKVTLAPEAALNNASGVNRATVEIPTARIATEEEIAKRAQEKARAFTEKQATRKAEAEKKSEVDAAERILELNPEDPEYTTLTVREQLRNVRESVGSFVGEKISDFGKSVAERFDTVAAPHRIDRISDKIDSAMRKRTSLVLDVKSFDDHAKDKARQIQELINHRDNYAKHPKSIDRINKDIRKLEGDKERYDYYRSAAELRLARHDNKIEAYKEKRQPLIDRVVGRIDEKLAPHLKRIEELTDGITALKTKIDGLIILKDELHARLKYFEQNARLKNYTKDEYKECKAKFESTFSNIFRLQVQAGKLEQAIAGINKKVRVLEREKNSFTKLGAVNQMKNSATLEVGEIDRRETKRDVLPVEPEAPQPDEEESRVAGRLEREDAETFENKTEDVEVDSEESEEEKVAEFVPTPIANYDGPQPPPLPEEGEQKEIVDEKENTEAAPIPITVRRSERAPKESVEEAPEPIADVLDAKPSKTENIPTPEKTTERVEAHIGTIKAPTRPDNLIAAWNTYIRTKAEANRKLPSLALREDVLNAVRIGYKKKGAMKQEGFEDYVHQYMAGKKTSAEMTKIKNAIKRFYKSFEKMNKQNKK